MAENSLSVNDDIDKEIGDGTNCEAREDGLPDYTETAETVHGLLIGVEKTMIPEEIQIIEQLTGVPSKQIRLADDGFWSRGYIIDNGRIVFKFKKSPDVSYKTEAAALNFVGSLDLGVNTQRVGWTSPTDDYLGMYGVLGKSLEFAKNLNFENLGHQLAFALRKLHKASPDNVETIHLSDEITAWQKRYQKSRLLFKDYFSDAEITRFDHFIFESVPEKLKRLGEKLALSHGDLGDGNIFVDSNGKVGIIDFNELCFLDEAADFMDVSSNELRQQMLESYDADDVLCQKVHWRVLARPLFVLGDYIRRNDEKKVQNLVADITMYL